MRSAKEMVQHGELPFTSADMELNNEIFQAIVRGESGILKKIVGYSCTYTEAASRKKHGQIELARINLDKRS